MYGDFFSASVNISALIFSLYGQNLTDFLEDGPYASNVIMCISFTISIVVFIILFHKSKRILNTEGINSKF